MSDAGDASMRDVPRQRLASTLIPPGASITEAVQRLDLAGTGALLLSDDGQRLRGLLTDGDVRRALLRGVSFSMPCSTIATADPVTLDEGASAVEALQIMNQREIDHLPIVDTAKLLTGFLLRRDLVREKDLAVSAVIMAGGFGSRLKPLTDRVPKPMLPVGDRPLLERTIARLRDADIRRVHVTTHHLADQITGHFGDGESMGVDIRYISEESPLGTCGGLRLFEEFREPMLVINGDILTGVNFADLVGFHRKHGAEATVCVRKYDVQVPYGVIDVDGIWMRGLREKPSVGFFVNAGIYLLEPSVQGSIPEGVRFDMTDLIARLLAEGRRVATFPVVEYWLDVGQPADYAQAQRDIETSKIR
jgi:dTDP-glucose pyrophosphorylase/CBS domain-containing protein